MEATATLAAERARTRSALTVRTLATALLTLFAFDNLLLLNFWGLPLAATAGLTCVAAAAFWLLLGAISDDVPPVPARTFAIAFLVSTALFALGGEGRLFYANTDWQIRDAVLHDLATNPWPFAYDIGGSAYFLRAPLGMYLLAAKFGAHAEVALLLSNSLRLALLLTLGWHLFASKRDRVIGLVVFLVFSGWDIVGTALYSALGVHRPWDHIEQWNFNYEYSSHVTQAFWVPQHAIAGWACSLAFLLWRRGYVPVGLFAATIALVAIWSPLAIIGAVPFALFAAFESLRRRRFDLNDVAIAALALAIALPTLLYLEVDAASVGMRLVHPFLLVWALCIGFEVLPFAWPLLREQRSRLVDRPLVWLILLLLLVVPLGQIGASSDFQMRASIMPLALLSICFAQWLCGLLSEKPARTAAIAYALTAMTLGSVTALLEVRRAVINGPSPPPRCSLIGAWNQQDNMIVPYSSYLAPVAMLPSPLRQVPVTAGRSDPDKCWQRRWVLPEGSERRSEV
jgi:hypothetical protein